MRILRLHFVPLRVAEEAGWLEIQDFLMKIAYDGYIEYPHPLCGWGYCFI